MQRESPPGVFCRYVSGEGQIFTPRTTHAASSDATGSSEILPHDTSLPLSVFRFHALNVRQDNPSAPEAGRRREYQPNVAETGMRKTEQSWEGKLGEYTLRVELRYFEKPNGYMSAEVKKTLRDPGHLRQKWTDFGFTREQPPVWQAEQHFTAYVKEAQRLGFKPQVPAGKPTEHVRRKWIGKYETEVRPRTLRDAWRDERLNAYAGMEVEA